VVLLLDVMDTLVVDPFHALHEHFAVPREALLRDKHPTTWIELETGALELPALATRFWRDGRPVDVAALAAWMRGQYRWIEGIPALLDDLRAAGHELHALTNYPPWTALIDEALDLSARVPWTFASWRTGLRKPDPRAYTHAAQHLGRRPEECLLVDDRPANVEGALAVGMPALLFQGADALRRALRARGLL
jgi:HAD superfamily hydrolase (TIGR01509 family)